jgi:hypothetical protein
VNEQFCAACFHLVPRDARTCPACGAQPLARCALRHPTDVVEGMEVVDSLTRIRDPAAACRALRALQAQHPAHAVRVAASQAEQALGKACDA